MDKNISEENKMHASIMTESIKAVIENFEHITGLRVMHMEISNVSTKATCGEVHAKKINFITEMI